MHIQWAFWKHRVTPPALPATVASVPSTIAPPAPKPRVAIAPTEAKGDPVMHDELVTPENLSKELLHGLFDAAFMENRFDDDGDLIVKCNGISCFVLPSERRDRIKLLAFFRENGASAEAKLRFANRVNTEYVIIRAAVTNNNRIAFDHDVIVTGGVTKKAVALAVQRFLSIPGEAISELDTDHIFL